MEITFFFSSFSVYHVHLTQLAQSFMNNIYLFVLRRFADAYNCHHIEEVGLAVAHGTPRSHIFRFQVSAVHGSPKTYIT